MAIDARAAVRAQIGGVERLAREMATRLPALAPQRYAVLRPPGVLAHRIGHAWEQGLALRAARFRFLYCPANLAPVLGAHNVVVIHDAAALRHPDAYSRAYVAYQRRLLPAVARRARLVITVSEFSRGELVDLLGVPRDRIRVIAPGVEPRRYATLDASRARARYRLERPYVLAVGTVSARKNLAALEAAAGPLRTRGVEVVVAGSDRGYLRGAATSLRRLGYVPDALLPHLYAGARAVAMPSRHEGFGLPCLEAMAAGVPVVAARRGALPDTVGDAGLLANPDDHAEFAAALVAAACEDDVREPLIERGRRRVAGYSWARTAALTDQAIGELLSAAALRSGGDGVQRADADA